MLTGSINEKTEAKIVEFNSLSPDLKWRYLEGYWSKASKFYGLKQELIIPDGEVQATDQQAQSETVLED